MNSIRRIMICSVLSFTLLAATGCARMNGKTDKPEDGERPVDVVTASPWGDELSLVTEPSAEPPEEQPTEEEQTEESSVYVPYKITNNQTDYKEYTYSELTSHDKEFIVHIDDLLSKNIFYIVHYPSRDELKYDFDKDGNFELLVFDMEYPDPNNTFNGVFTATLGKGRLKFECVYDWLEECVSSIGICDIDRSDDFAEIFIETGDVYPKRTYIFRLRNKNIEPVTCLYGALAGVSGDGKAYYWGGNLMETYNEDFNPDYVLEYYDLKADRIIKTDQIIGRTFTDLGGNIIFRTKEEAPYGPPREPSLEDSGAIRYIKEGEKVTILELSGDAAKIKTEDGLIGWIGGFHIVWN